MLTPILATPDPYAAADEFVANGWSLVFATPADSDDRLTCVELLGARVMLGVDAEPFLPAAAADHRGAGIQLYVDVPQASIAAVHAAHRNPGPLEDRPWGAAASR